LNRLGRNLGVVVTANLPPTLNEESRILGHGKTAKPCERIPFESAKTSSDTSTRKRVGKDAYQAEWWGRLQMIHSFNQVKEQMEDHTNFVVK